MLKDEVIKLKSEVKLMNECGHEDVIDYLSAVEAMTNLKNMALISIEDYILFFASASLLNAYAKKKYADDEFKGKYEFKNIMLDGIHAIIENHPESVRLHHTKKVTTIEVAGLQFGFHSVKTSDLLKEYNQSDRNQKIEWQGLRLQPAARKVFNFARNLEGLSNKTKDGKSLEEVHPQVRTFFAIVGASGAGKNYNLSKAMEEYDLYRTVSFTTRPLREKNNEVDGVDYHFISEEEFREKVDSGNIVESVNYNDKYYGLMEESFNNEKDNITPIIEEGVDQILKNFRSHRVVIIYIYETPEVRHQRMLERGDSEEDISKRFEQDHIFDNFYSYDYKINSDYNKFKAILDKHGAVKKNKKIDHQLIIDKTPE